MLEFNVLSQPGRKIINPNTARQKALYQRAENLWECNSGRNFKDMINQYASRLEILHAMGFLRGKILYPMMGNDILPGFFGNLIGLNMVGPVKPHGIVLEAHMN